MATHQFDVVVIGGGNAGMGVSVPTREAGLSVAMLEPDKLGGTCSNRGCTPKKVLVAAAHALDEIARAGEHHISVGPATIDWAALIDREKHLIAHIPGSLASAMTRRGVELVRQTGRFVGPNAVAAGDDVYEAGHVVIATGSTPRALPFPGADRTITSDDVLSERRQPREAVFIGGGVIAFEFAHVYARAGTRVTILQRGPRFLARHDQDAVERIVEVSRRVGIDARANVEVTRIEPAGDRLRVVFEEDGAERTIEADRVVNGAGRVPNIAALDPAAGEVAVADGRLPHDDYLRSTTNEAVYISGDSIAHSPQLSPVATYEGRLIGRNIVEGARHKPEYDSIPHCVFTIPALASVGMTGADVEKAGLDARVHVSDMSEWLSGRTWNEPAAWAKVISDRGDGRILGAHIVGHGCEELIHLFAFAMRHGIPAGGFNDMVYAFPTFAADVRHMV